MSRNLEQLYQEVILEHNRNPKNLKFLDCPSYSAHGVNPLCGDDYFVYINVNSDGMIEDLGFQGSGCAISKSSASMMTVALKGKSIEDALKFKNLFLEFVMTDGTETQRALLGKLKIFEGVKNFPIRVKCVTLIWRALEAALTQEGAQTFVSTE